MLRRSSGSRLFKQWTKAMTSALRLARSAGAAAAKTRKPAAAAAVAKKAVRKRAKTTAATTPRVRAARSMPVRKPTKPEQASASPSAVSAAGVETGRFRNRAGTRAYRFFMPASARGLALPPALLVLLHGCAQDAERFAACTRMDALAEQHGFCVLYPEQSVRAQRQRCWNWFDPQHQQRGSGEPSLIAGMARKLVRQHRLAPRRVYVAGFSAGGAMAVVLGETYAELFRAVGVYAGMPYQSAQGATSAFLAMRGRHGLAAKTTPSAVPPRALPVIVVQGDRDRTVHPSNASIIVRDALARFAPLSAEPQEGTAAGRTFSLTRYRDSDGDCLVEHWTIHGGRHAWSGGGTGLFADPLGPDISSAMVEFFLALPGGLGG
ncbi:poly(hydroxyalkanoate) depolymerase family esterase [Tahibacter aquaticus]|uniref:Poly(Hydroxyalkanoate) depolymerase family esterase n=1 Tax=Tahibacter aquaticus TaxID=520092 RepID=A0A4R6YH28_9GAMM|nr:PHB depolymerase family esterase [Tahibacter aquaticus]TDR35815.1 poly(hydroxyalkanoate) depolymerase family esterase [Tahibacter aquaticus]